ncbi:MAG: hypothetical protein IT378_26745 [Sandaracinaceae bacterium]|nr:hypothetical protein [Sandaracinaceae bacterium]
MRTKWLALTRKEKDWAEGIFAALLPGESAGLPSFASLDHEVFWRCVEESTGATFLPGLRVMVHALTHMPRLDPRYRRPFHALSRDDQETFLAELARKTDYPSRQLVSTLKIVAAFAYFDAPSVRDRFEGES